jgi:hypothetical protein
MQEAQRIPPAPGKGLTVRLDTVTYEALRRWCYEHRCSFQEALASAVNQLLGQSGASFQRALPRRELWIAEGALDLWRRGPTDLRKLLQYLIEFWGTVRK